MPTKKERVLAVWGYRTIYNDNGTSVTTYKDGSSIKQGKEVCKSNLKINTMPVKKSKKKDPQLVSLKQKWEPQHIASKFKCKVSLVREAINTANKNGKACRSRVKVEKRLKEILAAV